MFDSPIPPITLLTVLRRLALWTVICTVSAAPSFIWAASEFNREAMVFGVGLFILVYTASTCTPGFERFHRRPFVRRTLYIGYGIRLTLSLVFPLGMAFDLVPGMMSLGFVENVLGMKPASFEGTLATTIVQGTILNVILAALMGMIYVAQRMFCKPPEPPRSYGFEVVMTGQAKAVGQPAKV